MSKAAFASATTVSIAKSKAEIERLLTRYGADQFAYAIEERRALIGFAVAARKVRFVLPLPAKNERRFTHRELKYGNEVERGEGAAIAEWEQENRRLWRSLALIIKAKLEAVASGIVTFESEFLSHFVMPNGRTVGEDIGPKLLEMHESGKQVPLLGGDFN